MESIINKVCTKCKVDKNTKEFVKDKNRKDGLNCWCKPCMYIQRREKQYDKIDRDTNKDKWTKYRRKHYVKKKASDEEAFYQRKFNYKLKSEFKTTREWFNKKYLEQNGKCEICQVDIFQRQNLAIDHNHQTNKVRALLCGWCNSGLGYFRENSQSLNRAADYIIKYNG